MCACVCDLFEGVILTEIQRVEKGKRSRADVKEEGEGKKWRRGGFDDSF